MITLNPDFKDFIQLLNLNNAKYLLVGGYAVALYGYVRYTSDMDIWISTNPENVVKVVEALKAFGLPQSKIKNQTYLLIFRLFLVTLP
jgi:hypothetical protein